MKTVNSKSRRIKLITKQYKKTTYNMLQAYLKELSVFDDEITFDNDGSAIYKYFDYYWVDTDRYAFFLMVDNQIAGFVLIRELSKNEYELAEFYVLPTFRLENNGAWFAKSIIGKFPGSWELSTTLKNAPAIRFWNKITNDYYDNYSHKDKKRQYWSFKTQD